MAAPHSGAPSTSDGDGAESSEPRAVSLDDLFGDPRPVGAADDGGITVGRGGITADDGGAATADDGTTTAGDGGTTTADGGAGGVADVEPGSWADSAWSDGIWPDDAGAEPGTGPRVATFEEPAGDCDLPEEAEPARAVSFDELSGRRARSGTAARGPRRDSGGDTGGEPGGEVGGVARGRERRGRGRTSGPGQEPREARRGGRRGGGRGSSDPEPERTPAEQEARAKEICLRLLTDRARTVKELGDALRRKEIPDEIADRVLARFDEVGLIDDKAFADQWVRSRHRYRGLGKRAIALELHRKGVDREIADEALTEIDDESERERARDLVAKRLRSLPIGTREERQATARKLVGMLARKGYGAGVAYGVVKDEIAAAGADAEELGETPPED
ncbi:regulatory protein RecX [Pseudonocardia parietis]|uniref:Regulatory protein RecX n=1 Tax=Pseudonocardia parietis TaxID=570936 RepID=A0ABS4W188_9PSEU|nr:regulatory protein RecX [Pseudonocardia parietis]MBP2369976.1 regulatory protein [Pseudonocardia parietis]